MALSLPLLAVAIAQAEQCEVSWVNQDSRVTQFRLYRQTGTEVSRVILTHPTVPGVFTVGQEVNVKGDYCVDGDKYTVTGIAEGAIESQPSNEVTAVVLKKVISFTIKRTIVSVTGQ